MNRKEGVDMLRGEHPPLKKLSVAQAACFEGAHEDARRTCGFELPRLGLGRSHLVPL